MSCLRHEMRLNRSGYRTSPGVQRFDRASNGTVVRGESRRRAACRCFYGGSATLSILVFDRRFTTFLFRINQLFCNYSDQNYSSELMYLACTLNRTHKHTPPHTHTHRHVHLFLYFSKCQNEFYCLWVKMLRQSNCAGIKKRLIQSAGN